VNPILPHPCPILLRVKEGGDISPFAEKMSLANGSDFQIDGVTPRPASQAAQTTVSPEDG
jgi:hypothetical protein